MKTKLLCSIALATLMGLPVQAKKPINVWRNGAYTAIAECDSVTYRTPKTGTSNPSSGVAFDEESSIVEFNVCGSLFNMVKVPGGIFMMGAQSNDKAADNYDPDALSNEGPVHAVTLSDFYIGEIEVTQGLWEAVMEKKVNNWSAKYGLGPTYPAYYISYDMALEFINKLNAYMHKTGALPNDKNFCLPTEAEWEFAAHGGMQSYEYKFAGGTTVSEVGWMYENAADKSHPVRGKNANELGLYDMCGNVYEWVSDWFAPTYDATQKNNPIGPSSGSYHVLRGGSWGSESAHCRNTARRYSVSYAYHGNGLRLCLR